MSDIRAPIDLVYVLLAHEHPELCARLADRLLESRARIVMHVDAKAGAAFMSTFMAALTGPAERIFWAPRVRVVWGEWSMVEATLNALRCVRENGLQPEYVQLISGADYPIRPLAELEDFLGRHRGQEFIETRDADTRPWVQGGPQQGRYRYWHWFNWRAHPHVYTLSLRIQKALGVKRRFPRGLHPHLGSQWWTLTWRSCQAIMELAEDANLVRFFRSTWIPDELFFQSLIHQVVDKPARISNRSLTHSRFSRHGLPLVFSNGHEAYLLRQDGFFARKISPHATQLRAALDLQARQPEDATAARAGPGERQAPTMRTSRWHWGQAKDPLLGELEWNLLPYIVIVSASEHSLREALQLLPPNERMVWHGRLFAPDAIAFSTHGPATGLGLGLGSNDTAIRDIDRLAFLHDLIQANRQCSTGFALLLDEDNLAPPDAPRGPANLLEVLGQDANATLVVLDRELPQALADAAASSRAQAGRVLHLGAQLPVGADQSGQLTQALDELVGEIVAQQQSSRACSPWPEPEGFARHQRFGRKKLLLHIGVHRTGTTAVQKFLHRNREHLPGQGLHYAFNSENHAGFVASLVESPAAAAAAVQALIDDALQHPEQTTIVSAEDLCRLKDLGALRRLRRHFDVHVVCYVRRQDAWMQSWYSQNIKWPWSLEFSTLSADRFLTRLDEFHWLKYDELLSRWAAVFGRARLCVRVFEPGQIAPSVVDDFSTLCGLDGTHMRRPPEDTNASVSPAVLQVLSRIGLYGKSPVERNRLIASLQSAFRKAGLEAGPHSFSARQRLAIVQRYARANHWVAETFLGRADGVLFRAALPADDPTPVNPEISDITSFCELIAGPMVRKYLTDIQINSRSGSDGMDRQLRRKRLVDQRQRLLEQRRQLLELSGSPRALLARLKDQLKP